MRARCVNWRGAFAHIARIQSAGARTQIAVNGGARLPPQIQRIGIAAEGDSDILQDPVDLGFDAPELFLVEDFECRQAPPDKGRSRRPPGSGGPLARGPGASGQGNLLRSAAERGAARRRSAGGALPSAFLP